MFENQEEKMSTSLSWRLGSNSKIKTYSSLFADIKLIKERPDAADNICGLQSR